MGMKMRRGWKVIWADGTEWLGDCPKWATAPLMPGAVLLTIRILGAKREPCTTCALGLRH